MRTPMLALVAASGAAVLAASALPASARSGPTTGNGSEGTVGAAELLSRVKTCDRISHGLYRKDQGSPAKIPVCGTKRAVFWKADMDIDCDGRTTAVCNSRTDPSFQPGTAFQTSAGKPLDSSRLPYIVVPGPGPLWKYADHGIKGGGVAAVIHGDKVRYAVVGDTGPTGIIGEASYATAEGLGIDPDPKSGGTASGVTYILFRDSVVSPVEDHAAAVEKGEALAREFVTAGG
ncbi:MULTISPECIES: glycoside hydrolase family 75 protein [unclassified Streptomyces]|uniref:glycoside hydrolase family 75 protein n=1 Tax=unclassified Streptomyces TaxID=2593676 RepID=UPI0033B8C244